MVLHYSTGKVSPRRINSWIGVGLAVALLAGCATATEPEHQTGKEEVSAEIVGLSVSEIQDRLDAEELTSEEIVAAYLERIGQFDSTQEERVGVGAIVSLNESALEEARELDRERKAGTVRGPLHGIPVLVKDNINTSMLPTSHGNKALATFQPHENAEVVKRLLDAGAIVLGKTNMAEFAMFWDTVSSVNGRTYNPFDPTKNINGSSGGSAAAVASSFSPIALGTESCGSLTDVAAFTNLVGMRPTVGVVSSTGTDYNLMGDSVGPIALTVQDAAIMLDTLAGSDSNAPWSMSEEEEQRLNFEESLSEDTLDGKRIGYFVYPFGGWDWEESEESREIEKTIEANLNVMRDLGAEVVEVDISSEWVADYIISDNYWSEGGHEEYFERTEATWPDGLAEQTEPNDKINFGDLFAAAPEMEATAVDWLSAEDNAPRNEEVFTEVEEARDRFAEGVTALFTEYQVDAMSYPTVVGPPATVHENPEELIDPEQTGTHCGWANFSDRPVVNIPAGKADGFPVGLSLLGDQFQDSELLSMAYALEQATEHHELPELSAWIPMEQ